jgi:hypothetical protein
MMIRPYKPRDSARFCAAGLQYVTDDPGLAVHPRRVLHDPAAPDWRGEIRVTRRNTREAHEHVVLNLILSIDLILSYLDAAENGSLFLPRRDSSSQILALHHVVIIGRRG